MSKMSYVLVFGAFLALIVQISGAPAQENQIPRIVNGTDAVDGEFPFVVSIRFVGVGDHTCGASLLSPNWILTAAHCAQFEAKNYEVQYGGATISPDGPNVVNVSKVIVHEHYRPGNHFENDIAVMELAAPVQFGPLSNAVELPERFQKTPGGSNATLIGWGLLDSNSWVLPTQLQKVNYFITSQRQCNRAHDGVIHQSNICAYYPGGGKGQCSGDSGGPLLVDGQQVGVVSWSVKPCTVAPYPGVLTRVSHYIDWIADNTGLDL